MRHNLIYFSPTYSTQKIVTAIGEHMTKESLIEYDLTSTAIDQDLIFTEDDLVVIGIPVYSGRVPKHAMEKINFMQGSDTPAVLVAVYGNRDYDDALLELKDSVEFKGFKVIAGAAFVAEHSIVRKFGAGRPNDEDIKKILEFAEITKNKLETWSIDNHKDIRVKGNKDYRKYIELPIKPYASSSCNKCGVCAKSCPAQAIPKENPKKTIKDICITCMRCTVVCPQKARDLSFISKLMAEMSIAKHCKDYKRPEIFI